MPLQNTASRILALALTDSLPGGEIRAVGTSHGGCYCDYFFEDSFSSDLLILLDERIRQIVREKREIQLREMVPFSASELLKKRGQEARAEEVLEQEGLVQILQIDQFADFFPLGKSLSHTGEVPFFKCLRKENLGRGLLRVFGVGAPSKPALKEYLQAWESFSDLDHERAGGSQGLWVVQEEERVWLSRGLDAKRRMMDFWREMLTPFALEIEGRKELYWSVDPNRSIMEFTTLEEEGIGTRGLLDKRDSFVLQVNSFTGDGSSFLQTIHKSLTILGFTYSVHHLGRKKKEGKGGILQETKFCVKDALGCEWPVAHLFPSRDGSLSGSLSMTVWIERNLALLIEKSDGLLPFWIALEQLQTAGQVD